MKNSTDFLLQAFKAPTLYRWTNLSYAQEGEDMILARYFYGKQKGFYADIGAYHPVKYSNTYYFYKRGWRGINIDARPGSMELFCKIRPNDINIEAAISDKNKELTYFMFDEPALNGFLNPKEAASKNQFRLLERRNIATQTLSEVLTKHLPRDQKIDYMSVDVEGLDEQVISSNNWSAWKPEVLLIEDRDFSMEKLPNSRIYSFLKSLGYEFFAKTVNTAFFRLQNLK